jgi:hypothetical protein
LGRLAAQPHGRRAHRDDRVVRARGRAGPDRRNDGRTLRRGLRSQRLGLGHELLGDLARPADRAPGGPDPVDETHPRALALGRVPDPGRFRIAFRPNTG